MNNTLTNRQIAFILFGIIVGYGIMPLSKNVAENAGTGGWFTLLIATAVTIIFTYIITYLGYVHENKTIYEYSQILTGKFFTTILMIIYIIYFFMLFTFITRMTSEVIRLTILLKTPVWALCLLFLSVVYYAVSKGLRVIARICEIYGVIIILLALTVLIAVSSQGKFINLKPFFVLDDIGSYIKATSTLIFPFIGVEILTIIPFSKKENNRKVFKYTLYMVAFIGIFYISTAESCISVMGVDGVIHYKDSLLATIRRVEVPYLEFLRRLDGVALPIWIMAVFCTLTTAAYGSVFLVGKLFKNVHHKKITLIVIFLAFIITRIPSTTTEIEKLMDYTSYLGLIVAGPIPIILFITTKVKKYDKKTR